MARENQPTVPATTAGRQILPSSSSLPHRRSTGRKCVNNFPVALFSTEEDLHTHTGTRAWVSGQARRAQHESSAFLTPHRADGALTHKLHVYNVNMNREESRKEVETRTTGELHSQPRSDSSPWPAQGQRGTALSFETRLSGTQ